MSIDTRFTAGAKLVKVESLTTLLTNFRQQLERENGNTINRIDANVAELLSDLCHYLELSDSNRRKVIGANGARHVDLAEGMFVNSTVRH